MKEKKILVLGANKAISKGFIYKHSELKEKARPISTFQDILGAGEEDYIVYLVYGHNWNREFGRIFDYIRLHNIECYKIEE